MPILVDFNQVFLANIMSQIRREPFSISMVRHMVISNILTTKRKFSREYGRIIICADAGDNWRKHVFKYYKSGRKKAKEKSPYDWEEINGALSKVRTEIRDNLPFKLLRVDMAEADDLIAVLTAHFVEQDERVLIYSGDKDFIQLQRHQSVVQYSPLKKDFISHPSPEIFLKEQIITGDRSDGVPNILSPAHALDKGIKQASVFKVKMAVWVRQKPEEFCDETQLIRYRQNQKLIDLDQIPEKLQAKILRQFEEMEEPGTGKLYKYFMSHGLGEMLDKIGEFR